MRLRDQQVCKDEGCSLRECLRTRVKKGEDITVFGLEYRQSRRWRVWISSKTGRSYSATWRLCPRHDRLLFEDFEQIGRDEVNEYNATTAYYLRRKR